MATYRKKPVEVEAEQFTYTHKPKGVCMCSDAPHLHVHTMHEGQVCVLQLGDWVVAEPDGEHYYPVKDDDFRETYDLVEGS